MRQKVVVAVSAENQGSIYYTLVVENEITKAGTAGVAVAQLMTRYGYADLPGLQFRVVSVGSYKPPVRNRGGSRVVS
jgi:hypothetical protein